MANLIFVTVICAIVSFAVAMVDYKDRNNCDKIGSQFPNHEYSLTTGCLIEIDGKLVPLKNVRFEADQK